MNTELLTEWSTNLETPFSVLLSSRRSEIYPSHSIASPSITDQCASKVKQSEDILKELRDYSHKISKKESDLIALSNNVIRDTQILLDEVLRYLPLPAIDWEEEDGFINLSWRINPARILSVLLRGDSYAIFSGVFENGEVVEGTPSLDKSAFIIRNVFETYSGQGVIGKGTSSHRRH